jgi:hypothetical protein
MFRNLLDSWGSSVGEKQNGNNCCLKVLYSSVYLPDKENQFYTVLITMENKNKNKNLSDLHLA